VAALGLNMTLETDTARILKPCINRGRPRRAAPTLRSEVSYLLRLQGDEGVDFGGAARWDEGRNQSDEQQKQRDQDEGG